jgi:SAM-dependent methyltransferase
MHLGKSHEDERRLYGDLAWTWPIVSPPEDYVPEGDYFAEQIRKHSDFEVKTLLHLGCGGGHNDFTLKRHFEVTGVDVSETMLGLARKLNPDVTYLQGDMRSVRLGSVFDSVAILDAVNYMLTREDLRLAFETAFCHLRPGGVLLTTVEQTPENFRQNLTRHWTNREGDTEITFIENSYDPDPGDSTYESTFVFLIRRNGRLEIEMDRHTGGIFPMDTWMEILQGVGFAVSRTVYDDRSENGEPIQVLVCTGPGPSEKRQSGGGDSS